MGQKQNMRVGSTSKFNNVFICKKKKNGVAFRKLIFSLFFFFSFSPKAKIPLGTAVGCKENCEATKSGSSPLLPRHFLLLLGVLVAYVLIAQNISR